MHIQIANIHTPELVSSLGFEGHLSFRATSLAWHLQMIEITIHRQNTPTSRPTQLDSYLLQGCANAVGAQLWVLSQFFNFLDGSQRDFPTWRLGSARFVWQACKVLLGPATEHFVDRRSAHIKIASDTLLVPAFVVQFQDDLAALNRVRNIRVAGVTCINRRCRAISQDKLDSPWGRTTTKTCVADGRDFSQ